MARNIVSIKYQEINSELQDDLQKLTDSALLLKKSSRAAVNDVLNITTQLKERLRDTVYRFFAVIDAIDDLVCIKSYDGTWKTLNVFGQKFYNLMREDYLGKTDNEIITNFPNLTNCLINCKESDDLVWINKSPYRHIQQFIINEREYFFDIVKTPVYTYNGDPKELIIIGRDVTSQIIENQKNNACLMALNSASDSIALLDKNKKIIFFNSAFINNFPNIENDKHLSDIYRSIDEQYEINKWNQLSNCEIWTQELTCIIQGKQVIYDEKIIPIMNGNNIPIHYICMLRIPK